MKFYPADWRADEALRSCSIAARGLWIEMLALMHNAEPYGSLLIKGKRVDKKRLASLVGISEKECSELLFELEGMSVFSRDEDGTIYSRKMRRAAAKLLEDQENGAKGGNPQLKGGVNPHDNRTDNGQHKAQILEARIQNLEKKETRANALSPEWQLWFDTFWQAWPNKVGKPAALKALQAAAKRGADLDAIIIGVQNYVRDKPPDRPWLNPATFLNQNRWEDQPASVGPANGKNGNISAACDNLVNLVNQGFGGASPQDGAGSGTDETDAQLLSYRRG